MTVGPAVNLLWCDPGRVGGSEQYLVRQLIGLSKSAVDRLGAPTLYCTESFRAAHPELADRFPTVVGPVDGRRRPLRVAAEHTWLARRTRHHTLVHHGGGTAPAVGGRPIVLTVHDLQYETFPEYVHPIKLRYLRAAMPRSVDRAAVIAVPTDYVRTTVVDRFGVDADRVRVVPHGVEPDLGRSSPEPAELRSRFGLGDGRVLVLPAITHPHKGHRFALGLLAERWTDPDLRLVLLGGRGAADAEVESTIDRLGLRDRVIRPGRVSDADRDGLISLAHALVFPSEYEGFGAPAVEAMTLGTPVICSDQAALAEVVGDAGLALPLDGDAWAGALDEIEGRRDEFVDGGRRRAGDFTAERSGAALAEAYRAALAGGGAP